MKDKKKKKSKRKHNGSDSTEETREFEEKEENSQTEGITSDMKLKKKNIKQLNNGIAEGVIKKNANFVANNENGRKSLSGEVKSDIQSQKARAQVQEQLQYRKRSQFINDDKIQKVCAEFKKKGANLEEVVGYQFTKTVGLISGEKRKKKGNKKRKSKK